MSTMYTVYSMKKEVDTTKKVKIANELQDSIIIKDIKTIKPTKPKAKKELTAHEFILQPIVLVPAVFLLLFAALALWTTIIPADDSKTTIIAVDTDPSFRIKDSVYLEHSKTKNGVPYSISIKYPQILSSSEPAQSFGEQISVDIVDIAQTYFKKIDEQGNNDDIENILEGTYTFTSEKDPIVGDIAIVTLNIHEIGKNKISINPEDNSDILVTKEYKFNITQNQITDVKQLVSIIQ